MSAARLECARAVLGGRLWRLRDRGRSSARPDHGENQRRRDRARQAGEMLVRKIETGQVESLVRKIPYEIVIRHSL